MDEIDLDAMRCAASSLCRAVWLWKDSLDRNTNQQRIDSVNSVKCFEYYMHSFVSMICDTSIPFLVFLRVSHNPN